MSNGHKVWEDRQYKKKLDKNQKEITEKLDKLSGVTKESIYSGIIAATIVEAVSLLLVSMYSVTTKEIHEIYKRVVNMEEGLEKIAGLLGTEYGDYDKRKIPPTWLEETYEKITKNRASLDKNLDAMFGMLYEIDKLSISEKQVEEKGWFGKTIENFKNKISSFSFPEIDMLPQTKFMEGAPGGKIPDDGSGKEYLDEEDKSKLEEIKELNEESKELIKGVIDKLIDQNYNSTKENIEAMPVPHGEPHYDNYFETASYDITGDPGNLLFDVKEVSTKMPTVMEILRFLRASVESPKELDTTQVTNISEADAELIAEKVFAKMQGGEKAEITEKTEDAVTNEDLGIEVRDSKRSIMGLLNEIKNLIASLIKVIEKRALTFDEIYTKFGKRLEREVRDSRGRR